MSGLNFDRPVGAAADVKELQYIIALHQTSVETRENSTVSSLDIMALLKSRYGLTITHEEAIDLVHSFGGGGAKSLNETQSSELVAPLGKRPSAVSESPDECVTSSEPKALPTRSDMMKQLHNLQSRHVTGCIDHHSMIAFREQITADLAAQVMQKTQAHRNLAKDFPDDVEHAAQSVATDLDGKETAKLINKNVSFKQSTSFAKSERGEGPLPEYLDIVQILSIILTPKFAKLAQDVTNEPKEGAAPNQDDGQTETNPGEVGLKTKLANRFLEYGRRKLEIKDEKTFEYSAAKMLDMGKTALLKSLPNTEAPVVDDTLVMLLLLSHGEVERANDERLVAEMVAAATTPSGVLDQASLIKAISSDLGLWDTHCQDTNTSFFYDVYGIPLPSVRTKLKANTGEDDDGNSSIREVKPNGTNEIPSTPTANEANVVPTNASTNEHVNNDQADTLQKPPKLSFFAKCCNFLFPVVYYSRTEKVEFGTAFLGTDSVLDTSSSSLVAILIWIWYILNALVYGVLITISPQANEECPKDDFWCVCVSTVVSWSVIAIMLIMMGFYLILPLSAGNNPADLSPQRLLFACVMSIFNTILPFWFVQGWARRNMDKIDDENVEKNIDSTYTEVFALSTLVFGCFLFFTFLIKGLLMICVDHRHPHRLPRALRMMVEGSSWSAEARVYKAAKSKIDMLFCNAVLLHDPEQFRRAYSHKMAHKHKLLFAGAGDQASRNFILHSDAKETVGGFIWTFWRLFDGSLYDREGIWFSSRLIIIQITQIIIAFILSVVLLYVTLYAAEEFESSRDSVKDEDLPDWVMDIFPTGAMIMTAFIPAAITAMVMQAFLILVYVPSSVTTILKFRGQINSSFSVGFQRYRTNVDTIYMNTANALWAMAGSTVSFYFIIGFLIFLCVWPISRDFVLHTVAWATGLGISFGIKMVITSLCRKAQHRSFYRIKPAAARLSMLALECWYIGIAGSVLIGRACQFLLAALFWLGRIDVPFLSDDVVLMGYRFDMLPCHFFKDLLVHEAHRHPYIEQLSQMYLMKLRNGDRFLSNAGVVWRQLLIVALFPWLAKHRVFGEERLMMGEVDADEVEEMEKRERDAFVGVHDIKDSVVRVGTGVSEEVVSVRDVLYGAGADVVQAAGGFATNARIGMVSGGEADVPSNRTSVVKATSRTFLLSNVGVDVAMSSSGETDASNQEAVIANAALDVASSEDHTAGEEDSILKVEVPGEEDSSQEVQVPMPSKIQ